jgi:dTDP-4-amino-4,6-dideoxygalactose transaminase
MDFSKDNTYITKPIVPPFEDFELLVRGVWDRSYFTNFGPLHASFEQELKAHFGSENLMLFNNGTSALMIAMRALGLRGEILVTPFTFPATIHALEWIGLQPVFCDIERSTLNIDPAMVEKMISNRSSAILGVHLFGYPCNVEQLTSIASHNHLSLLFDSAHAFFSTLNSRRLALFGDVSMLSLHATKVMHCAEGGILFFEDDRLAKKLHLLRNFGIEGYDDSPEIGINGKLSELHAALGLTVLKHAETEWVARKKILLRYRENFRKISGCELHPGGEDPNDGHYAVLVFEDPSGKTRDRAYRFLHEQGVIARRYFYPMPSQIPAYQRHPSSSESSLPIAHEMSRRVLILPLFGSLPFNKVDDVCELVESVLKRNQ